MHGEEGRFTLLGGLSIGLMLFFRNFLFCYIFCILAILSAFPFKYGKYAKGCLIVYVLVLVACPLGDRSSFTICLGQLFFVPIHI